MTSQDRLEQKQPQVSNGQDHTDQDGLTIGTSCSPLNLSPPELAERSLGPLFLFSVSPQDLSPVVLFNTICHFVC